MGFTVFDMNINMCFHVLWANQPGWLWAPLNAINEWMNFKNEHTRSGLIIDLNGDLHMRQFQSFDRWKMNDLQRERARGIHRSNNWLEINNQNY